MMPTDKRDPLLVETIALFREIPALWQAELHVVEAIIAQTLAAILATPGGLVDCPAPPE